MQKHVAYVDGLRAIAILAVVMGHVGIYTLDPRTLAGGFVRSGLHGVDLFFVISGFCLSYPTLLHLKKKGSAAFDLAGYTARRIVRIVPPYYIALAVLIAAAILQGSHVSVLDVLTQMLFLDRGGQTHMLNPMFWTLPVEFRWYALFPIVLWLWTRSPNAFGLLAVIAACSTATKSWSEDLLILPAFMLGIVAAHFEIHKFRFAAAGLPLAIAFAVLGNFTTPADYNNYAYPAWQLSAFFFAVSAGSIRALEKVLSWKPLRAVGVASYSIYLVHGPVLEFAVRHGVNAVFGALIAIACGFAFWWAAERPFVSGALRRRLIAEFDKFLPRWFAFFGIGRTLNLTGAHTGPASIPDAPAKLEQLV